VIAPTRLVEIRKWLGLSQEKMAQLLGVSFASVNRWEGGGSGPTGPTIEVYRALDVIERRKVKATMVIGSAPVTPGVLFNRIFQLAYGAAK
jgi:type I restriction enzyme M protein